MKTYILHTIRFVFISASIILCSAQAQQESTKPSFVKNKINSEGIVFVASTAIPLNGMPKQLTSYYYLDIFKDSLSAYLPYFGRAYIAPMDASESSIDIQTTSFTYTTTPKKKGGWDIIITPKDQSNIQSFTLTYYDSSAAYLNVRFTNRDPISFNGSTKTHSN